MITNLSNAKDATIYGNKAKGLYDLIKIGLKVPEGFAISFDSNSSEIKSFVKNKCSNKKLYVVRSSSSAEDSNNQSFAGLFDTFVGDNQRIKEFCKKINKPISSIKVGVVVQELISSDISGVCFTKEPVKNNNVIYIESILGLGEYIVSGEVTPDRYKVSKKYLSLSWKKISAQHKMLLQENGAIIDKPILNYTQKMKKNLIINLAKGALKVENYYKKPMDIEFAIRNNNIYYLQARPITTLK
jgi:pyruvate,water dikinase